MAINLFDPGFYRANNVDLASLNDAQAFGHFLEFGANEGRRFSPYVNLNFYRANNPDLAAAGLNTNRQLYDHLSGVGVAEGRNFSPVFNANFYRGANPDLAAAGLNNEQLFDHFRAFGLNEGRQAAANFQAGFYLASNPDLTAAGFNFQQAVDHYILSGIGEGRIAAPGGVVIQPPPPPTEPGNTPSEALNIGVLSNTRNFQDNVNFNDRNDYYRFEVPIPTAFIMSIDGTTATATPTLYEDINSNGQIDDGEYVTSINGSESSFDLSAGTYFIRVEPDSRGRNTNYTLGLTGNNITTTTNLGVLSSGSRTVNDFVGRDDRRDWYIFSLANPSEFTMSIGGTTASANAYLYEDINGNGQIDDGEYITGINSSDRRRNLSAGSYFVVVATGLGNNTNYTLELNRGDEISPQNRSSLNKSENITNVSNTDWLTGTNELTSLDDGKAIHFNDAALPEPAFTDNAIDASNFAIDSLGVAGDSSIIADVFGTGAQSGDMFAANPLDANFNSDLVLM
ncbi:MAG: hypothetical protein Fur0025_10830 [Oscillatoriaceae cyanobacterium]